MQVNSINGDVHCNMHVILLWTMQDMPAYGTIVRCVVKGYKKCPICGPNIATWRSQALLKNVYCAQHKKWLPMEHAFQRATTSFDGVQEDGVPPQRMTFDEIHNAVVARIKWLANGGRPLRNDLAMRSRLKRLNTLFQLEYWKVII
jgi:hypothetical protein